MIFLPQKPLLAKYASLKRNLSIIDNNRFYSNYGPLYYKLKKKIEKKFRLKKFSVSLTSSGHSAIQACCNLIAHKNKKKFVLVPSYSFASDPQAIIQSGLKPFFVDINLNNYEMDYEDVKKILNQNSSKFAAILICSPFGYPVNMEKVYKIFFKYKIPIIYDAADAIINTDKIIERNNLFYTFSFHPTKNLPGNESGMIISSKIKEESLKSILNFGIDYQKRDINFLGFNGKFSEYDAAILDANLNKFQDRVSRIKKISKYITKKIINKNLIIQENYGSSWFGLKLILRHKTKSYNKILNIFNSKKISIYKPWNEKSMDRYNIFYKYQKTKLKNTKKYVNKIFGVPVYIDMKKSELDYIIKVLNNLN
jgi:dTDP-4-amino-4,6-dideoxygalactose transaminase